MDLRRRLTIGTARRLVKGIHAVVGPVLPPAAFAVRYPAVPGRIHLSDLMLKSGQPDDVAHYYRTGREGADLIAEAARTAGRALAETSGALVLPCGYGRVVRHLVSRLPARAIWACDIERQAIRFCASEFGVHPLASHRDPHRIALPRRYDVVFVGSLFTHLPPPMDVGLLQRLSAALAPGGVLVFTTQGESCLEHLWWYGAEFAAAESAYRRDMAHHGVAFSPYAGQQGYGITIHSRARVERYIDECPGQRLRLVAFEPRGWDRHQDVWVVVASADA